MKRNTLHWVHGLLAGGLVVTGLTAGCGKRKPVTAPAPATDSALAVRAAPAAVRTFERRLTVQGTLEAKVFANVASRIEGNLDEVWVDEGDTVVAGRTALFQVDAVNRANALTIAEQALAVSQASLAVAQASAKKTEAEARKAALDYERYARLHKEGRVSVGEFETREVQNAAAQAAIDVARAQVDLAGRQVKQAESACAIARKNLADAKVLAPISGAVSARRAEPGEQMSIGKVVMRIDDLSTLEAAAFLPAQYYSDVTPGKTEFRLEVNGRDAGRYLVTYRSPTINPTLRTFEIKGLFKNEGDLCVPGNLADLTLVFETRQGVGVPSASVIERDHESVVFVVRDGKAVRQTVTTGLQNDGWTEIRSGLEAGTAVMTEGQTQVRDGQPVDLL